MAIIKTLKENELMGGMENGDLYPISSTQAIFSQDSDGAFPKGVKPLLEDRLKDHEALLAKHTSEIKNIVNADYFNIAKLWQILADSTDEQINISHLTDALSNYALKSELPKKLKTLTFDGLIKGSYNGSEDVTLTFPTNISAFANDAHYVTKAELGDTSLDSAAQEWVRSNFISKVANDTAQGIITFNKGLISYANTYIGSENESSYLKYDAATKQILIKGSLSASTTIDGLAIKDYIKQNGISEDELNNLLQGIKNDLQSQLDGSIETWYYEGEPTLENLPAKDWDTDEKKKAHSGDLYYDKSTGKAYRFTFDTDHYLWLVITDSDITKALREAAKAQETADGKMTVFTTSKNTLPTPPYQVGDIWVNAYYGEYANELLRCVRGRSGEVGDTASINDWIKASKYTDDSALDKFKGDYLLSIQSYKRQLDGTVVTWFGDEAPSLNNAPVSEWSEQDKADHAGDLYYDRTSHEVYKWSGATWFVVNDPKLQEALELASKAQDTADSKRTTFLSQPKGPYDEGDQWIVTTTGEDGTVTRTLMVCIKGTTTEGYFSQDDWVKSNDADLNEYAKLIEESLNGLKDQLDKKAETWYQAEDPSTAWTTDELKALHKGDLWYNTTDNTTWYYNGIEWVQQDVPDGVFDKIDGKSAVYIEKPLKGYNVRDLWILEAEYTLYGGVTYKAGELVTALNSRAEGEWESTDWIKKVNYTDDTLAQDALNKIGETNKVVANLNTTVTDFKNAFDEYTKDGYLEGAEIAALKHDMDRIQDAYNASKASYDKIYATITPDNYTDETDKAKATEVKANLKTTFDKLTEHLKIAQTIRDSINAYNTLSDEDKTTTYARVSGYFTNFTTYYNDFCTALNAAYDFIFNDLYSGLTEAVGQTKYLREAILQGSTDINGGLILSSMLALRDKNNDDGTPGAVMSGINGVTDSTDSHKGIATWWGGKMIDKENNPNNETPATAVIRFDGSGYFANGNISWGPTGTVTIKDLTSLWGTDDTNILQNMSLFTSGTYGSEEIGTEVLILPKMRFGNLFIRRLNSDDLNNNDVVLTQGELKDLFVSKEWFNKMFSLVDDKQKDLAVNGDTASATAIRAKMDLYSEKGITALGYSSSSSESSGGSGGGGLDAEMLWSVLGNSGTEQISKSHLTDALSGYATEEWVENKGYLTTQEVYTKTEIDAHGWSSNKGTVISVGITMPTGFSVSGSPITEKGTLAIGFANGYSLPTTAKQRNWDSVYNWYSGITGSDTDTIINKWGEIISFLDGIEDTATLSGIVNGINQSITAEANRAKSAEQTLTSNVLANATAISKETIRAKDAENTISSNLTAEIDRSTKKDDELSKSITDEISRAKTAEQALTKSITDEVSRAKAAEQTLTSNVSANTSAINVLKGYFTNGVAKSAVKLQTARKIWGNAFDGTQDVAGDFILPNGKQIKIGGASLSWDADNNAIKINGNVYATGGVSALGNSDTTGGGGGGLMGTIVPYEKAIALTTQNEGEEIASAWSVKMLYDKIETIDVSGQLTSYLTKSEAQSLYQPVGNYLTGITKAQVEGVLTGNITSHTHSQYLTSHQSLSGYATEAWVNAKGYITSSGSCAYAATSGIANAVAWGNVSGKPTSMPASDVYAWAKAATKPNYTYDEIKVKSLVNVVDFTRVVIALCEVTKSQAYTGTFSSGEILYYRGNGVIPIEYARVNFIDSHSLNYDAGYSLETSAENESKDKPISNLSDFLGFRKCTFVYNGKHYAGVEAYFSQAASYYWRGYSYGHTVFGVIVEQNNTIKNEEIYNSLSYNGQNRSYISFGSVRADSFVKKGSSDSYVLLGGGGHALISSLSVATAAKLQTARTIWGQRFDGTGNVDGNLSCNGQGSFNSLQIGNITISYDEANKGLRIAGGGLYTDSYLSSLGVDASTALSVKKWADSIQITTESDAELATAYSIGNLYRLINSNQKTITESLNQSVSALQGRCTSLEQRVSALEKKVNK